MSELKTALQMVADRTTLRTILVPTNPDGIALKPRGTSAAVAAARGEHAAGQTQLDTHYGR